VHEKRIEIRWRDMDAYGHVNNTAYLTYLEEVRDEWLDRVLGEAGSSWGYVLARVAIDFRAELRQTDDVVVASCRLARIGTSSIRTREEVRKLDGTVAAEAEVVLVARDLERSGSRSLGRAERAAFERELPPGQGEG
jgi:acyl-CoA thioester hydrolase